ncbi:MAG: glycosyltransferase family 4 protein [Kiritimatiellaeota bacterium]|nr:glycosyltransferase family 4 protein [Kiritimatiellota bacterium]
MNPVRKSRAIVLLAQTPPPYHGQAVMTQVLKDVLEESFEVHHVRMAFSQTIAENKKVSFLKLFKLIGILVRTLCLLVRHPGAVLYYPPAPGHWVPVLRDLVLLTLCRPFAGCTVFHFHARGIGEFLEQHRRLPQRAWRAPEHAIVLGASVRQDAEFLGAQKIHEIPCGVDIEPVPEDSRVSSRVRIFFAGFHIESKGIFDVLETARELMNRQVDFEVHMAGEWASSSVQDRFLQLREEYGLESRVKLFGVLTGADLQAAYARADIFFFPTFFEHETFGVVVIEAMAHGLPVVASVWPGPCDIIRNQETGFLCSSRNVDAYADALQSLIENSEMRAAMGFAGWKLYEEKYTRAVYGESMRKLFAEICNDAY